VLGPLGLDRLPRPLETPFPDLRRSATRPLFPHFVELDWQRSTGPGAFNGSLQFWIDNASVATLTGIDDDLVPVDQVRMGALSLKTGAAGTLYFDQFESRRQRLIGPE